MMRNIIALLMSAVACVQSDSLTGKHFYIHTDFRTWNEARTICEDNGGRLAQIDNQQLLDGLLAYAKTTHWKQDIIGHFWIGLNRVDRGQGYRWDRCESLDVESFTFWDTATSQDATKHCVYAERDTLRWFNEVCDSTSYQYLCQKDTGPCTYSSVACSGSSHGETSEVAGVDVAGCEDLCSSTLQDEEACWTYSYDSPNCTLFYDDDPWACRSPPPNTTTKTRTCFTFQSLTSSSIVSDSNSRPNINCDLYTTQTSVPTSTPPVKSTTTTDPTTPHTTSVTTTTDHTTPHTTSVTTTTDHTTPHTTSVTTTTDHTTPHTTSVTTTTDHTTPHTTSVTTTTDHTTPHTTSVTTTTDPTTPNTASVTTTTDHATPDIESVTMTTDPTITMATTTTNPTSTPTEARPLTTSQTSSAAISTASTTQNETSSTTSSQMTIGSTADQTTFDGNSTGNSDACPCWVCFEAKNMTEMQDFADAILRLLKIDKSKLSATRRKLNSEPDERPSAQAIGYSGIVFIVITFSFFVLVDLTRLCQLIVDRKIKVMKIDEEQDGVES